MKPNSTANRLGVQLQADDGSERLIAVLHRSKSGRRRVEWRVPVDELPSFWRIRLTPVEAAAR